MKTLVLILLLASSACAEVIFGEAHSAQDLLSVENDIRAYMTFHSQNMGEYLEGELTFAVSPCNKTTIFYAYKVSANNIGSEVRETVQRMIINRCGQTGRTNGAHFRSSKDGKISKWNF